MTARADGARRRLDDDGVGRYYDPTTGQFITVDPLVDETGAPYSYTGDDPVDATDPLGLCCGFNIGIPGTNIAVTVGLPDPNALLQEGEDITSTTIDAVNSALPYVHQYSGYAAVVFSGCAVVTSETVVGGATCGALALAAGAVTAGSGSILYAEHRESGATAALDLGALGASGVATLLETSARAAATLSAADRALAQVRVLRATEAPLSSRPGLWLSAQLLEAKSALWNVVASGLYAGARAASGSSIGFGFLGDLADREGLTCKA